MKEHNYAVQIEWTGNDGSGTASYKSYRRDHAISVPGKAPISASSDPAFRGDAAAVAQQPAATTPNQQ